MILHAALVALLTAASPFKPVPDVEPQRGGAPENASDCAEGKAMSSKPIAGSHMGGGVSKLPFAMGKSFHTLDEYLVHLKCVAAPIDLPWWREIRPGVYEQMTTKTGAPTRTATRAELMKRFGFSR